MKTFDDYLAILENKSILNEVFNHIRNKFPELKEEIKWNQPMYILNDTFIIAFSVAKNHFSIAPEEHTMVIFEDELKKASYSYSKKLFRIKWTDEVNYDLLDKIISYNIDTKKGFTSFWR